MLNTQHFLCLVAHLTQICQILTIQFSIHQVINMKDSLLTIINHQSKIYIFNLSKRLANSHETFDPNSTTLISKRYRRHFQTKLRIKFNKFLLMTANCSKRAKKVNLKLRLLSKLLLLLPLKQINNFPSCNLSHKQRLVKNGINNLWSNKWVQVLANRRKWSH
jgi:hypothetical protein